MSFATSTVNAVESFIVISILALVHLFAKELRRLRTAARNALLSAGAGASLAYVLLRILPKLAEKQDTLMASIGTGMRGFLEHHAYLVAMAGLVVFYGISLLAAYGAQGGESQMSRRYRAARVLTVLGYCAYSLLIGYLIVNRLTFGLFSLVLICVGMGMVFLVNDHGLWKRWPEAYDAWIRWVLTLSLLVGWALGAFIEVSPNVIALWYAFLAGIILITTIGEKLAIGEGQNFLAFLTGVLVFTAVLLVLEQLPDVAL